MATMKNAAVPPSFARRAKTFAGDTKMSMKSSNNPGTSAGAAVGSVDPLGAVTAFSQGEESVEG